MRGRLVAGGSLLLIAGVVAGPMACSQVCSTQAGPASRAATESQSLERGGELLRAHRFDEALNTFRDTLRLNPRSAEANIGLGRAMAAMGNYPQALAYYDEALRLSPGHYDALQGKAYVLLWASRYAEARAIFEDLAERRPTDPENAEALERMTRAEEEARWAASRPAAGAPPEAFIDYFRKRLGRDPKDKTALKALAYQLDQLQDTAGAIEGYQRVLALYPNDRDSKLELARLMTLGTQYGAAIRLYREIVRSEPNNTEALEALANVYARVGEDRSAVELYRRLMARQPSKTQYQLQAARLELRLGDLGSARELLTALLASDPENRQFRLELAQTYVKQGRFSTALRQFRQLLGENPYDPEALYGKARVLYYQGKFRPAEEAATTLLETRPGDMDGLLLMARIQRARGRRRLARRLLNFASHVSPANPELRELETTLSAEPTLSVHTSASFAREIGSPTQFIDSRGFLHEGLPNDDLRSFTYSTSIGFSFLPRTESYLTLSSMPSKSPAGPLRDSQGGAIPTGTSGTSYPEMLIYRQTRSVGRRLNVRMGGGVVRFGSGGVVGLPGEAAPIYSATYRPLGLFGLSLKPTRKLSLDFDASRSAITYTPVSTKFGVVEDRISGRLNLLFNARTELHVEYYHGDYSSARLKSPNGAPSNRAAEHDQSRGGSVVFNRTWVQSGRFSLDGGYSGQAYGFDGRFHNTFLGFFNPVFYQSHMVTARIYGKLCKPVGYELSGGAGLQRIQLDPGPARRVFSLTGTSLTLDPAAVNSALIASPSLIFQMNPHLSLTVGYTYYNSAQSLGMLRGNAVRLAMDWKF